jgi:hypothetical protein
VLLTDQPRATHPAWEVRDLEQTNWSILPLNPQENTCMTFENNVSTRLLERDNFLATAPCISNSSGVVASNSNDSCTNINTCKSL